ncbi:MAG: DUF1489 domain-containing protein [Rhodospirillales bacterium CG15_BIG_FIL_POST_REV_8_21_14_020_66_15]|nr:MAG: DUF1489 domain-containing protein [Rhodospirillales bacterium CG15_BIG_FIL_POST_REV_8_21_14_020_66_15]
MPLHLIKLCVGVESIEHLAQIQRARLKGRREAGEDARLYHVTRMWPRRQAELLDGGSIYWVIKRVLRCRQRLLGFDETVNGRGQPACGLVLDPEIVPVRPRASRAFQGWRYLTEADAPADMDGTAGQLTDLPPELADELRGLGLI